MEMKMEGEAAGVMIVSSPGMGHLIPALELASSLATRHGLHVTLAVVSGSHAASSLESRLVQSASARGGAGRLHVVQLPPVDVSSQLSQDTNSDKVLTHIRVTMHEAIPALKSTLSSLAHPVAALIVDFLGAELLGVARELGIPRSYVFATSNAWCLALMLCMPMLDKAVEGDFTDLEHPLQLPGCRPVRPEDLLDSMMDRRDRQYHDAVRRGMEITMADGVLVNVWEDLEPVTLASLRDDRLLGRVLRVPVYPIGPLTRGSDPEGVPGSCGGLFGWLDGQPGKSVVYVCFGSGGTLSFEQMIEVAWGLELSQQRFVWVVREPNHKTGAGSYLSPGHQREGAKPSICYLPDGFEARTKNIGLLATQWAPQAEVLRHPSVGAFLTHCGWNSALESITNGVPMIACPIHAEQRLNATLLKEELGVAVRPKASPSKGVVGREEIKTMIRSVLAGGEQGKALSERVRKLQGSAVCALNEGGSSYNALAQVARECKMSIQPSSLT